MDRKKSMIDTIILTVFTFIYFVIQSASFMIEYHGDHIALVLLRSYLPLVFLIMTVILYFKTQKPAVPAVLSIFVLPVHLSLSGMNKNILGQVMIVSLVVLAAFLIASIEFFSPKFRKAAALIACYFAVLAVVFGCIYIDLLSVSLISAGVILFIIPYFMIFSNCDSACETNPILDELKPAFVLDDEDDNESAQSKIFMGEYEAQIQDGKLIMPESFRPLVFVGQPYRVVFDESGIGYEFDINIDTSTLYEGEVSNDYMLFVPEDYAKQNEEKTMIISGAVTGFILHAADDDTNSNEIAELLQESEI